MKVIATLFMVAVVLAKGASGQKSIEVFVTSHEGDVVGPRFSLEVRERIARSAQFSAVRPGYAKWELHIITTDDDQHLTTNYRAGLVETSGGSRVRMNTRAGHDWTPVQIWVGSVESSAVDQQADTLVARVAAKLDSLEKKK